MKSIRSLFLIASVIFSTQLFSQTEITPYQQRIPLEKAMQDIGLIKAMYNQIDPSIFHTREKNILAYVNYKNVNYIVYGSLDLWIIFFTMDPATSPARPTALL